MSSLSKPMPVRARWRVRAATAVLSAALLQAAAVTAQSACGDGVATELDDAAVAALQGPVFTTQVLRADRELLLVTRDRGSGREARDAYVFVKEGDRWVRAAQFSSNNSHIEGAVQDDALILFGERGQGLVQFKLKELRDPAPAAPAAPAQQPG